MSLISPLHLAQEQFLRQSDAGRRRLRIAQIVYLLPAIVVVAVVVVVGTRMLNAGWLLTATSILTGLTFSMTTTFWGKSIDARRSPQWATNSQILETIDENKYHLMWTVLVGVLSTASLALTSVFANPTSGAPVWATALCAGLFIYLLTLVVGAIQRFAEAALILR